MRDQTVPPESRFRTLLESPMKKIYTNHRPLTITLLTIGFAGTLLALTTTQDPVAGDSPPLSEDAQVVKSKPAGVTQVVPDTDAMHAAVYENNPYPSAQECGSCHPLQFAEWSTSPHAYAMVSPVFNTMQAAVTSLTNGTNGDFCIRCHSPVAMATNEPIYTEIKNRSQSAREGVTCIVCHRVNGDYGKVSGRFKLEAGDIHAPIYGPSAPDELERILAENAQGGGTFTGLKTSPHGEGHTSIHAEVKTAFFLRESAACGNCHDVTSPGGFRLEEAFSEFKSSPSAKRGESCQDCHMSQEEGKVSDLLYEAPAAMVGGKPSKVRRLTRHYFAGPDYSIIHPGIFPIQSPKNADFATLTEWQDFDLAWGSEDFEADVPEGTDFVHRVWESVRKRKKAYDIIYGARGQMEKLETYRVRQLAVLREAYQLGQVQVTQSDGRGLDFQIEVVNGTDGHNAPTGFIAERTLYLEVTVKDSKGQTVFVSGDLDPNGDVRDLHSSYVHNGALHQDEHLFSLQSKFMVRLLRGGEREQVLPLNFSASPLLFNRPASGPVIGTGRPPGARIHRVALPPNGRRWAEYSVPQENLTGEGPYTVDVRMIAGMVPVNLIEAIHTLGFDYKLSPRDVGNRVVAGRPLLWTGSFSLESPGTTTVLWNKPPPGEIPWWQKPKSSSSAEKEEAQ